MVTSLAVSFERMGNTVIQAINFILLIRRILNLIFESTMCYELNVDREYKRGGDVHDFAF